MCCTTILKSLKIFRPKAANFNVKSSITARFGYFICKIITQPQTIAIETVRKEQLINNISLQSSELQAASKEKQQQQGPELFSIWNNLKIICWDIVVLVQTCLFSNSFCSDTTWSSEYREAIADHSLFPHCCALP